MRVSDIYPRRYLRAEDLPKMRDTHVTIDDVEVVNFRRVHKPVLHFQRMDKALVLNPSNATLIVPIYGDELRAWIGKPLTLFVAMLEFDDGPTASICVHVPRDSWRRATHFHSRNLPEEALAPLEQPTP